MPEWTQAEAVAFEAARECITHMMSICSAAIYEERALPQPDAARLARLEEELAAMARERAELTVADQFRVSAVRAAYGERIRAYNAQSHQRAA